MKKDVKKEVKPVDIEVPFCRHCTSLNVWAGPWEGLKCKDCGMIDTRHPYYRSTFADADACNELSKENEA